MRECSASTRLGSIAAAREIFDRTDGRPRQAIDVGIGSGGDGARLVVIQMPDNGRGDRVNPLYDEAVEPLELPPFDDADEAESDVE